MSRQGAELVRVTSRAVGALGPEMERKQLPFSKKKKKRERERT